MAEIEGGRKLNESKTKDLSGGDTVVARHLYGHFFEFQPSHKVWMYGNHKPIVTGTDYGLWRRMHLIPFTVTIPEEGRRPMGELLAHAQKEMPGILNWAVEGLLDWKSRGLVVPNIVKAATGLYREESDTVAQFVSECCNLAGEVPSRDLYEAYQAWAGSGVMSWRAFQERMKEKGFQLRVGPCKKRFWSGVSLSVEHLEHL
ncbi:MAG: phage/plasmid primase, P4 family [Ignavibacteriales bacterium]|nr:phage/plasmid primase, P4 family [Ignavibacteriales bacterium]